MPSQFFWCYCTFVPLLFYWWLIMKKRGWKLYWSPNPNPRGVRKCNSAIFSMHLNISSLSYLITILNCIIFFLIGNARHNSHYKAWVTRKRKRSTKRLKHKQGSTIGICCVHICTPTLVSVPMILDMLTLTHMLIFSKQFFKVFWFS